MVTEADAADACGTVRYTIFDPTGNVTALVESAVDEVAQPAVAARIMQAQPAVEQVGFVRQAADDACGNGIHACLRMAGGEFCGNATMCAAAWYLLCSKGCEEDGGPTGHEAGSAIVRLRVSGATDPVEVCLECMGDEAFAAGVHMPAALGIEEVELAFGGWRESLPLVRMEGISHLVIEQGSVFFGLLADRASAEQAVRAWCDDLATDGLGLMFVEGGLPACRMTPLVYVPGAGTVFWERSCASGSSAVGIYLASRQGRSCSCTLHEPGGSLRVECDPLSGTVCLYGSVRLVERSSL